MKLQAHGIETDLPVGWEGRIAMRTPAEFDSAEVADGDASLQWEPEVSGPPRPDQPGQPGQGTPADDTDAPELSDGGPSINPQATDDPDGPNHPDAPDAPVAPDAPDAPAAPDAPDATPSQPEVLGAVTAEGPGGELHFPVAHLANFPLPEGRGDFGSGAVDIMTTDDVLLVLAEFGPECVNTPLFAPRDFPTNLTPNMFSGSALQRSHQGQAGCQIFFTHANRAFCLYTVLGRQSSAARVLPQANATLAATRITPR